MTEKLIIGVGLLAQLGFTSRVLVQWILSEKAKKSLSPTIFWNLSLMSSIVFMVYGILREDIIIISGQLLSYFIYIRNLQLKKFWPRIPLAIRVLTFSFPVMAVAWLTLADSYNLEALLFNDAITPAMLTIGGIGQAIFSSRFLYQWFYSERKKESSLPVGFWLISITGSSLIFTYALLRLDYAVLLGHSFGLVVYIRNAFLHFQRKRKLDNIRSSRMDSQ